MNDVNDGLFDWNEHSDPADFDDDIVRDGYPVHREVVRRLLCGADVASRLRDLPAVRAPSSNLTVSDDQDLCYLINWVRDWAGVEL